MTGDPGAGPPALGDANGAVLRDPGPGPGLGGKPLGEGEAVVEGRDAAALAAQPLGAVEAGTSAAVLRPPEPVVVHTPLRDVGAAAGSGGGSGHGSANGGSPAMRYLLMGQSVIRAVLAASLVEPSL
jgi:hypothetical protein